MAVFNGTLRSEDGAEQPKSQNHQSGRDTSTEKNNAAQPFKTLEPSIPDFRTSLEIGSFTG